jgi:AraC family transcriptional regulator
MTTPLKQVQPVMAYAAKHLDEDVSLGALADQAGLSAFHLHRVFARVAGETPKQFTLRLRLDRAATLLVTGQDSVLNIALACGFQSHEAFTRAFRKRFGLSPSAYRARGLAGDAREHAAVVSGAGACLGLFHTRDDGRPKENGMAYSISKKEIAPQKVLAVRRRVKQAEIAAMLGEVLGRVFLHAQQSGIALAGPPFARYLEWGPGLLTIEAGFPVATHAGAGADGEIRAETLPGGLVATTVHPGAYDKLTEGHAAVQQWIEAEGLRSAGGPWESYVTDPGEYPDPKDWKTEIFWPLA